MGPGLQRLMSPLGFASADKLPPSSWILAPGTCLQPILADRFHWTVLHRFLAQCFLVWCLRLTKNIGVPCGVVASENIRRNISALITINALVVYIKATESVLCTPIFNVCHIVSPH